MLETGRERPDTVLRFQNVSLHNEIFGQHLRQMSLEIPAGSNSIIIGPEGSGKMLISRMLLGKMPPERGYLFFENEDVYAKTEDELEHYRARIGYISFNFGLVNNMTVFDNIALPLRYHTEMNEKQILDHVEPYLILYHLDKKRSSRPQSLNHNEKLRAAFIRSLVMEPSLIILDHALSGQCPVATAAFLEIARDNLLDSGTSFLIFSFIKDEFKEFADRYFLIYDGSIVFNGSRHEFFNSDDNPYLKQYRDNPLEGPMNRFFSPVKRAQNQLNEEEKQSGSIMNPV